MSLQDETRAAAIRGTEPGFPVRLVALDIDGTLVGDDLVVGPRTIDAVRAAKARGVAVSLVTGRMVSSAMRFARELGLTDPIIGYQGGLIRAMPEPGSTRLGKLLVHTPLRPATARAVVAWTREHGLDPHLNHLERFILRADDPRADDYSAFMGARAELVPDLLEAIDHPITKILAVGEPPLPTELAPAAAAAFAGVADVTISHPRFLEFVAPGVSKGRAIRWLARRLGIPLAQTLAIGDQWNDIEMLAEVGPRRRDADRARRGPGGRALRRPGRRGRGRRRHDRAARAAWTSATAEGRVAPARRVGRADARAMADRGSRGMSAHRRPRRRPRPRGGRRGAAHRRRSSPCPPTRSTGSRSRSTTPGGIERLFHVKHRPPEKGIVLLLDDAAQAALLGDMTPAAEALAAALLARRPDDRRAAGGRTSRSRTR